MAKTHRHYTFECGWPIPERARHERMHMIDVGTGSHVMRGGREGIGVGSEQVHHAATTPHL
jgi:hypothetical protein